MNPLLPGLQEAMRLLSLNDLDFGPGRILKRIEELKGETMNTEPCDECGVDTVALLDERDKLKARLHQVESQAAGMRQAISDFVYNVKHSHVAGWGDVSRDTVADNSFKELSASLESDSGQSILAQLEEARWLLEETTYPFEPEVSQWPERRDAWLSVTTNTFQIERDK